MYKPLGEINPITLKAIIDLARNYDIIGVNKEEEFAAMVADYLCGDNFCASFSKDRGCSECQISHGTRNRDSLVKRIRDVLANPKIFER